MHTRLRAVVLDNDETTGAYRIVIAFLIALQKISSLTMEQILIILERLADCMIEFNLFRPGLKILLKTLMELRKVKRLDAIIMYTNQKESVPEKATLPLLYSPPQAIAYMMTHLTDKPVFDKILTRTTDKPQPKSFQKVLDCFPSTVRKDIQKIVFVDDNATPSYILADTIPIENQSIKSWYKVKAYYRILSAEEFIECLDICFEDIDVPIEIFETIMAYYYANEQETNDTNDDDELVKLAEYAIKFF